MKDRYLSFIIYVLTPFAAIGIDLYSPSLPAIMHALHVSTSLVMFTISAYLIGLGLGQFFSGTLSDVYGRRPILLFGMLLFCICSILIIFSNNIFVILSLRFLQAFGAASSSVISKSLVTDCYQHESLVKISSTRTIIWGLGPIIAPVIGGYLQFYFGWRAAFYFFAIVGGIVFALVYFLLPETNRFKTVLNWEKTFSNYQTILTHVLFLSALILLSLSYALIITFHVLGPFLIQEKLKYSAIVYGHVALLNGGAYFIGTILNRGLITKFTSESLIHTGLGLMLLGSFLGLIMASWLPLSISIILVPTLIVMFGIGFVFPNCSAKALSLFPNMAGTAAAIIGSFYIILAAVVSYFVTFLEAGNEIAYFSFFCTITLIGIIVYWLLTKKI